MNEKKGTPWLICASGGFEYQMISDQRYLHLVRLGRERRKNRSRVIDDPAEFAPIMGNVRLVRSQIDSVHCTLKPQPHGHRDRAWRAVRPVRRA